jgi:acetylornithine deacetylase/succinyl-diaminopimelate desuccinylase-like protein
MTTDVLLEQLLVPRPNGSAELERSAGLIAALLRANSADVTLQPFTATPHGFQLLWTVALLLMVGCGAALVLRRHRLALLFALVTPALVLLETEWLWSPVSGLMPLTEHNVVGTYPGRPGGPTLILSAHYDTATHFGDHFDWYRWGWTTGPALLIAVATAAAGLWCARRGRQLSRLVTLPAALLALVPFGAMAWFFAVGPLLRVPSPGALDNGGAVSVLLQLAEHLGRRPAGSATTVELVFLAAEEERAMGSWHYARTPRAAAPLAVINLETVGGFGRLAYAPEEGFQFRRYPSAPHLVELVRSAASEQLGEDLVANPLPAGVITDARSFLAHGIPAVTLLEASSDGFPRRLHSEHDSRDRLSVPALERTVALLAAVIARADADPALLNPAR